MKLLRFQHLAEIHGGDIDRWPVAEREEARRLAAESREAQQALAEARRLDAWLSLADPALASEREDRIVGAISVKIDGLAVADRGIGPRDGAGPRRWWPAAAFLATMAVVGVIAGDLQRSRYPVSQTDSIAELVAPASYLTASYMTAWNR